MSELPAVQPGHTRRYVSDTGGFVDVHEAHGKQELRQNLPSAVLLADWGECVCLLPVIDQHGVKSADATRDGSEWEFKAPEGRSANAIDQALRGASKQAARVLLKIPIDFALPVLESAIHSRVRRTANVIEIAIVLSDKIHHFDRQEIINNTFRGKMG